MVTFCPPSWSPKREPPPNMVTYTPTYVGSLFGRVPLLLIGCLALFWQVQLIIEYYGGGTAIVWIAPLISVTVALCPHWAGNALREGRRVAGVGFGMLFVFLFLVSVMASLGRVGEFRAAKGSGSATAERTLQAAKDAVTAAEAQEAAASANVEKFCAVTTTTKTTTKEGSKKKAKAVSTQMTEADPRCITWTAELTRRAEATATSRQSPDLKITVADADADAKRIAAMLPFLTAQKVEEWQPAMMPLGLELIMALVFPFAFRPLEYHVQEPVARDLPGNVVHFPLGDCLMTDQKVVTGLVATWLKDEGLPVDMPIGKACEKFNAWLKRHQLVNLKLFGKALTDLGVQKRVKAGRTLIADDSHKPRRRTARRG